MNNIKLVDNMFILVDKRVDSLIMPGIFKQETKQNLKVNLDNWTYTIDGNTKQLPDEFIIALDHETISMSGLYDKKKEIRLYKKDNKEQYDMLYSYRYNTFVTSSCSHICWECFHYDKKKWKCTMKLEEGDKELAKKVFNDS